MAVTIYDVAGRAHVSVTTISKILNHKDLDISAETREKVLKIVKEMSFVPSGLARSLVTKKTNTIGLLLPTISNQYFAEIARGVENGANELGYNVIFCNTDESEKKEKEYLQLLQERSPDGIIMVPLKDSDKNRIEDFHLEVPYLLLDRTYEKMDENTFCVTFDNIRGGYIATKHLIEHGHRKIAVVLGPKKNKQSNDRFEGYEQALKEAGVKFNPDLVYYGNYDYKSGMEAGEYLSNKDITAVFATNDIMACGLYRAFRKKHIKIPDDISIVGYDNIQMSEMIDPELTTITQPKLEMGRIAAENIIHLIKKEKAEQTVIFEPGLVERNSVKTI